MVEDGPSVRFHFPADALQEFLEHVLGDIAADVGVSQLKSKDQRTEYLSNTPEPDQTERTDEARALSETPATKPTQVKPKSSQAKPSKPAKPFKDLNLNSLGSKTQALLREFRKLDVDKLPNTAAVLTRAILELSVDGFLTGQGLSTAVTLRKRIKTALHRVDPSHKAKEYRALQAGLTDGTSIYSVNTLHAFVHNPYYQADGTTVRSIAANIQPFLQKLNDLA